MSVPKCPEDQDLRNIIDKLANFVARNGPEFEQMTKNKQKDNPKFSFLFGGEHFNYYQYKVTTEQAILKQQQKKVQEQQQTVVHQPPPFIPNPNIPAAPPPWQQTQVQLQQAETAYNVQKKAFEEQIKQSEQNLAAQHQVMLQQQQTKVEEGITKAETEKLAALCESCGISFSDLDTFAQPIIESCTKDAISGGKNWIFNNNKTDEHGELISRYLERKITSKSSTFEAKLHLVYLINDVLHHCVRKGAESLKHSMENVVVSIFCSTHLAADEQKKEKLKKVCFNYCLFINF